MVLLQRIRNKLRCAGGDCCSLSEYVLVIHKNYSTTVIFGCQTHTNWPLITLAIDAVCRDLHGHMAAAVDADDSHPATNTLLLLRLRNRLRLETCTSVTNNDMDLSQNYWLHRQELGTLEQGKLKWDSYCGRGTVRTSIWKCALGCKMGYVRANILTVNTFIRC
jgi:hypothetical protein